MGSWAFVEQTVSSTNRTDYWQCLRKDSTYSGEAASDIALPYPYPSQDRTFLVDSDYISKTDANARKATYEVGTWHDWNTGTTPLPPINILGTAVKGVSIVSSGLGNFIDKIERVGYGFGFQHNLENNSGHWITAAAPSSAADWYYPTPTAIVRGSAISSDRALVPVCDSAPVWPNVVPHNVLAYPGPAFVTNGPSQGSYGNGRTFRAGAFGDDTVYRCESSGAASILRRLSPTSGWYNTPLTAPHPSFYGYPTDLRISGVALIRAVGGSVGSNPTVNFVQTIREYDESGSVLATTDFSVSANIDSVFNAGITDYVKASIADASAPGFSSHAWNANTWTFGSFGTSITYDLDGGTYNSHTSDIVGWHKWPCSVPPNFIAPSQGTGPCALGWRRVVGTLP